VSNETRPVQIDSIVQLLTDPENQPHQFVGCPSDLMAAIQSAAPSGVSLKEKEMLSVLNEVELYLDELDNNSVVIGHNYWGLGPLLERVKAATKEAK